MAGSRAGKPNVTAEEANAMRTFSGMGWTPEYIAKRFNVSVRTVMWHLRGVDSTIKKTPDLTTEAGA